MLANKANKIRVVKSCIIKTWEMAGAIALCRPKVVGSEQLLYQKILIKLKWTIAFDTCIYVHFLCRWPKTKVSNSQSHFEGKYYNFVII